MDPPYNHEFENRVLEYLSHSPMVTEDTLIIIEASKETDFYWLSDAGFHMIKEKVYKTNKTYICWQGGINEESQSIRQFRSGYIRTY